MPQQTEPQSSVCTENHAPLLVQRKLPAESSWAHVDIEELKSKLIKLIEKKGRDRVIKENWPQVQEFFNAHWVDKMIYVPHGAQLFVMLECTERVSIDRCSALWCFHSTRNVDEIVTLLIGEDPASTRCVGSLVYRQGMIFAVQSDSNLNWYWINTDTAQMRKIGVWSPDCLDEQQHALFRFQMEDLRHAHYTELILQSMREETHSTPFELYHDTGTAVQYKTREIPERGNGYRTANQGGASEAALQNLHSRSIFEPLHGNRGSTSKQKLRGIPNARLSIEEIRLDAYCFHFAPLVEDHVFMLAKVAERSTNKFLRFSVFQLDKHAPKKKWREIDISINDFLPSSTRRREVSISNHTILPVLGVALFSESFDTLDVYAMNWRVGDKRWQFVWSFPLGTRNPKTELDLYLFKEVLVARFEEKGITRGIVSTPFSFHYGIHEALASNLRYYDVEVVCGE